MRETKSITKISDQVEREMLLSQQVGYFIFFILRIVPNTVIFITACNKINPQDSSLEDAECSSSSL
ncbi:hypothetical protein FGQ54_12910 [Acinetobacter lwoffii]|nr:hypothetical protein FGQ54_12910 [Acinetobacter lwoffii]